MKDLNTITLAELRQMAKALGVKGWWNLNKAKAMEAIENTQNVPEVVEVEEQAIILVKEQNVPEVKEEAQEDAPKKNKKRLIEYNGKTQTLTAWAKELGMRHQTLYNRIVIKGWEVEKAFEAPTKQKEAVQKG